MVEAFWEVSAECDNGHKILLLASASQVSQGIFALATWRIAQNHLFQFGPCQENSLPMARSSIECLHRCGYCGHFMLMILSGSPNRDSQSAQIKTDFVVQHLTLFAFSLIAFLHRDEGWRSPQPASSVVRWLRAKWDVAAIAANITERSQPSAPH
jgi:hypothetical protein